NACLMARFDDEAIASRLEQFFGANQGHCAVRPSAKLLAEGRNSIYERAPLRERSEKEEWRMRLEPTLQFQNLRLRVRPSQKFAREDWVEDNDRFSLHDEPVDNAWLGVTLDQLKDACDQFNVAEEALQVSLATYRPLEEFEYDLN